MRRILLVLTVAAVMAALVVVMAAPAFARGALLRTPCPDHGYTVYTPGNEVRGACAPR